MRGDRDEPQEDASCLAVLVLLTVALDVAGVPFAWLAPWALVLVCPIMMLVMMRTVMHGTSNRPDQRDEHPPQHMS